MPPGAAWTLSGALAVATGAGAIPTVFATGILRGPAVMNGSVRGTALVMLAAGLPVLIMSMRAAWRGSARAVVLWLGSAAYLIHNAVLLPRPCTEPAGLSGSWTSWQSIRGMAGPA